MKVEAAMLPGPGLEMAPRHFSHMLLIKTSHEASLGAVGGEGDPASDGKSRMHVQRCEELGWGSLVDEYASKWAHNACGRRKNRGVLSFIHCGLAEYFLDPGSVYFAKLSSRKVKCARDESTCRRPQKSLSP